MDGKERTGRYVVGANARETAYRIIRDKIIFLDLKPGEPLSDRTLAEELKMSRTPVREALLILSTTNMVMLRPQSGTFVAPVDMERVEVEQFARYALEKEILTLACQNANPSLERPYSENLRLYRFYMEESTDTPDRARKLLDLDNRFHEIGFRAAGKEASFEHQMESLQHLERLRTLSLLFEMEDNVYEDHQAIATAVIRGDLSGALHQLTIHMGRYREHLHAVREHFPQYFELNPT